MVCLMGTLASMKSMMAELTDETNMVRGISFISVTWAVGCTIGFWYIASFLLGLNIRTSRPFIGGVLSRPQDRWPSAFSHRFWGEYPYFLPCLATAAYALLSFSLTAIFLKEVGWLVVRQGVLCLYVRLDCVQGRCHEAQRRGRLGLFPGG